MLAIMEALEDWRQYLLGAKHRVEVWTDHLNLTYFRRAQKLNRRQARWNTDLQPYDLKMVHKPGAMMKKTDILSRLAQFKTGDDDNRDIVLLPERFFALPISVFDPAPENLAKLRAVYRHQDPSVQKALRDKVPGWMDKEGIITFQERLYVPKSISLRGEIMRAHHNVPTAGHPGHHKTLELVTRNYYWPGMNRDIRQYVQGCSTCQRSKP